MKKAREFLMNNPLLLALIGFLLFYATSFIPSPVDNEWRKTITEIIRFAILLVFMILFVGLDKIPLSAKGMGFGFKFFLIYLILAFLQNGISVIGNILSGESRLTVSGVLSMLILGILVGPFEEITNRFLVFGGLCKAWKETKPGVMRAALLSSFLFGFAHVLTPILKGTVTTGLSVAECAAKTLSAGVIGFIFAAIYVATENIWVPAVLQSIFDFVGFINTASTGDTGNIGNYVNIPANLAAGISPEILRVVSIAYQVAMALIAIPMILRSVKILKSVETPFPGPLTWHGGKEA